MQTRLSQSRSPLPSKGLSAVAHSESGGSAARGKQPGFDGTISSACDPGIGIESFIAMARLARASDPGAARFLDAWDAFDLAGQQATGAADAVCEQVGLVPLELLRAVAEAAYRFSMYTALIAAAVALPSVVERSIAVALTDEGIADRKMLFQHSGFLPTPVGAQTNIAVMQNAQLNASAQPAVVTLPPPEETIRRLSERFNQARAK